MTPKQALKYWGGPSAIANRLGLTRQAVDNWNRRKWIPIGHQITLNSLSNGELSVTLKRRRENGKADQ